MNLRSPSAAKERAEDEAREFTQIAVEELEALLAIAAEYRRIPVSDGRPRYRQLRLVKQLEASRGR